MERSRLLYCTLLSILLTIIILTWVNLLSGSVSYRNSQFILRISNHWIVQKSMVMCSNCGSYSTESPRAQYFVNGTGFVLALHFSDQLTGSSWNLFTLQCWAESIVNKRHNQTLFVVEPFLHLGSILGATLEPDTSKYSWARGENEVRLRDVFNISQWSQIADKEGYTALRSWKYFLKHAPRKMILVGRECRGKQNCMECQHWYDPHQRFYESAVVFAEKHGFTIVHTTCFGDEDIDAKKFELNIYGEYSPGDVTVVFNHWGGIEPGTGYDYRVPITNMRRCERRNNSGGLVESSSNIFSDAKKYIEQFMPTAHEKGYIAVMVRWEHYAINNNITKVSSTEQLEKAVECINNVVEMVNAQKKALNTDAVFLAMDYGRYGSLTLNVNNSYEYTNPSTSMMPVALKSASHNLYEMLYGNSSTVEEWENSFDTVAKFKVPGYVALIQRLIAANSTALFTVGGGMFQESAKKLYRQLHSHRTQMMKHVC